MESLNQIALQLAENSEKSGLKLPEIKELSHATRFLKTAMFPGQLSLNPAESVECARDALGSAGRILSRQLNLCWQSDDQSEGKANVTLDKLFHSLPIIQSVLKEDLHAAVENDPVGPDPAEVIISYPGFQALVFHRLAHQFHSLAVPLLPRLISELAHSQTGIDIHPAAQLGPRCFIDHGTGVVIGETVTTGKGLTIYQGVTLGAKNFPRDAKGHLITGQKRHPTIGDFCTIYAGATILGNITVGHHCIIGGNVWITRDVPANSQVTQRHYHQELFSGYGDGI